MNTAPNTTPAAPSAAERLDLQRRTTNAEQVAQFLADDLTEARARCGVLTRCLENANEESRAKRIKLNTLAERLETVRDLVREGRCGNALNVVEEMLKLARAL